MSCQREVNAKCVEAKHVRAKDIKTRKLHACEAKVDHLSTKHVETDSATFKDVVITNTITIPPMGLLWSDVAQVSQLPQAQAVAAEGAPGEEARDVVAAEEPSAMVLDFMIPVTTPTAVAGRIRAGVPEVPVLQVGAAEGQVGAADGSEIDTDTDSDDDLIVKKCARIRKCLKVKGDTHIKGNLIVEGKIYTKCTPRHSCSCGEAPAPEEEPEVPSLGDELGEEYCQVKCRCKSSSCDSCCSSSSSFFSCSSHSCDCDHEALEARIATLEALVASLHP